MLGDLLQLVLTTDISDVSLRFDEDKFLEFCGIFDSTTSDDLSCKRDMEKIIFFVNNH